jgi:hypothetical protein
LIITAGRDTRGGYEIDRDRLDREGWIQIVLFIILKEEEEEEIG